MTHRIEEHHAKNATFEFVREKTRMENIWDKKNGYV